MLCVKYSTCGVHSHSRPIAICNLREYGCIVRKIGNEKPFIKENNVTYPCNAFQFGIAGQRRLGLLFVISKRYPRNHVIHVRVFNIDSLMIEDLDTLLYIYSLE